MTGALRAHKGNWLVLGTLILVFSIALLTGCFTARRYVFPSQDMQYRVFDNYLIEVYVGNRTASTYDYRKNDFDYHVTAEVQEDTLLKEAGAGQALRIEKFCVSGGCFSHVYCPPCSRDTVHGRFLTAEGVVDKMYVPNYYDYGWIEIPKECQSITVTFDTVLEDTLADTLVATEQVSLSLDRTQRKIPAIMPI
jgi:hypothetical protein